MKVDGEIAQEFWKIEDSFFASVTDDKGYNFPSARQAGKLLPPQKEQHEMGYLGMK